MMTGVGQARSMALREHIIREWDLILEIQEVTTVLKSEDSLGVKLSREGRRGEELSRPMEQRRQSPADDGG